MSTIGNEMLGAVQNQTSAKGKAGHGKAGADASKGADFASTVASLSGREGDAGRKGGRIAISGNAEPKQDTAVDVGSTAVNARHAAGAEHVDEKHAAAERPETRGIRDALRGTGAGAPDKDGTSFAEKAAALLDTAGRQAGKVRAGHGDDGADDVKSDDPASEDAGDKAAAAGDPATGTDVGNLLQMLAAPNAAAQGAQLAANGGVQDAKAEPGARMSAKADLRADAASKADAAAGTDAAADADDLPKSDADQLFRLIRADGKGRELDVNISGERDRATFRDASANGPKGETVTVLDTRRYIGLAQNGNAAAVTTAIAQDPEWAQSLGSTGGLTHAEAAATGKVVNTLKIQMHPIELGLVTATLRLHGDELTVALQVQTGEAYRQLKDDQDAIVKALRDQGFAVDQVSVQLSPADKGSGTQQGDGQNQQQQQFSSQAQAREGGNGRQGGGEQGAGNFGREDTSHEGNTSENAQGLAGSQSVRSGGVYL